MLTLVALLAAADPATTLPTMADGRYGLVMRIVTEADAAVVGKITTTTTTTAVVDITVDSDGRVMATQRACSMVTDGGAFKARGAPGFLQAMAPVTYEIHVDDDGRIHADLGLSTVGVAPGARTLPSSREGFTDPDRDGNIGAPLDVEFAGMTLRLDVASVGHALLEGRIDDDRHVRGRPRVLFSDERILGGPAFATGGTKEVVQSKSSFEMVPLSATATCDSVARGLSPR